MTEPDQIKPPEVTDRQSIAIDALVAGSGVAGTASLRPVNDSTK